MDLLRSCYSSTQALYPDRPEILTPGQWHFCPAGAKPLPFPTSFASSQWDPYTVTEDYPLGEQRGGHVYVPGLPDHRYTGQHFCGSAAVWASGLPYAQRPGLQIGPDGIPTCCLPVSAQGVAVGTLQLKGLLRTLTPAAKGAITLACVISHASVVDGDIALASAVSQFDAFRSPLTLNSAIVDAPPLQQALQLTGDTSAF